VLRRARASGLIASSGYMLSSIILLCFDGPEGSGFAPVEYLYTIGPGRAAKDAGISFV
jgi:hypothetical protein